MTTGTDGTLLIRITRPEGYEDVHPDLVLEDCGVKPEFLPEIAQDALSAARLEGWRLAREQAAKAIPDTWLDELLTGKNGVGPPPYSCTDIQRMLEGLRARLLALPEPEESP